MKKLINHYGFLLFLLPVTLSIFSLSRPAYSNPPTSTVPAYINSNIPTSTLPPYIIQATASGMGTISPSGNVSIAEGSSKTFTFTPNTGYNTSTLKVNSNVVSPIPTAYTFLNVKSSQTISVTFADTTPPVVQSTPVAVYNGPYVLNNWPVYDLYSTVTDSGSGMGAGAKVAIQYFSGTSWDTYAYAPITQFFISTPITQVSVKYCDAAGNWTTPVTVPLVYPITINSGATSTPANTVTLSLTAFDNNTPMGAGDYMEFSNDNTTWSSPYPFNATQTWQLTNGNGAKTVYVKFKNKAGTWSSVYSANIFLGDPTLVAYYNFSNGASDISGYNNNGFLNGNIKLDSLSFSLTGYSIYDGVSSYISIPSTSLLQLNANTISFWVSPNYINYANQTYTILSKGVGANTEYSLQLVGDAEGFNIIPATPSASTLISGPTNLIVQDGGLNGLGKRVLNISWEDNAGSIAQGYQISTTDAISGTVTNNLPSGSTSYQASVDPSSTLESINVFAFASGLANSVSAQAQVNLATNPITVTLTNDSFANHLPRDNNWHHVVRSWNTSGQTKYYIDGQLVYTTTSLAGPIGNAPVLIGTASTAGQQMFNGRLAQLQIYDRLFSDTDVSNLYAAQAGDFTNPNGSAAPNTPENLVAYATSPTNVVVKWADDSSTLENGFTVNKSIDGATFPLTSSVAAGTNFYNWGGLSAALPNYFTVQTNGAKSTSSNTNPFFARTAGYVITADQMSGNDGVSNIYPTKVAADANDNKAVIGIYDGNISGTSLPTVPILSSNDTTDSQAYNTFIIKYNSSGQVLWAVSPNPIYSIISVAISNTGDVAVTGQDMYENLIVQKYSSSNGTLLWTNTLNTGDSYDLGFAVTFDSLDNVFVAGTGVDINGNSWALIYKFLSANGTSTQLQRITGTGSGTTNAGAFDIKVDNTGIYWTGYVSSINSAYAENMAIYKLDPNTFDPIWSQVNPGQNSLNSYGYALGIDSNNNNVTLIGDTNVSFLSNIDYGPTIYQYSSGGTSISGFPLYLSLTDPYIDSFSNASVGIDSSHNIGIIAKDLNSLTYGDIRRYTPAGALLWSKAADLANIAQLNGNNQTFTISNFPLPTFVGGTVVGSNEFLIDSPSGTTEQFDELVRNIGGQTDGFIAKYSDTETFADQTTPPTGSVSISCGATCDNPLNLTLSATDPASTMSFAAMRYSSDDNTWTALENYTSSDTYSFNTPGTDQLYVQYRDSFYNWSPSILGGLVISSNAVSGGGSISPSGDVTVPYGADQSYMFAPISGDVSYVSVDGATAASVPSNTYTVSDVKAPHNVAASFSS